MTLRRAAKSYHQKEKRSMRKTRKAAAVLTAVAMAAVSAAPEIGRAHV